MPSLCQQEQVFSMGLQRLTDHYKIFTDSNVKWKVCDAVLLQKSGLGAGMERDYLLLERL